MNKPLILVTGGCGYIGTHTVVELLAHNFDVLIVDNLINSNVQVIQRIKQISGRSPLFIELDIANEEKLDSVFKNYPIAAVIHFAALKAVGESVLHPLSYYSNNVSASLTLFRVMQRNSVKCCVFSSSATVYGDPHTMPIRENFPLQATNPYGSTKVMIEQVLRDLQFADKEWSCALLRYFNPVGAHSSGLIGEDPRGIPNNLMPYISQVALGKRPYVQVFGNDYPTEDGTGVRDYIHVLDLARGHVAALNYLQDSPGLITLNLGTGQGYSVLQVIQAYRQACGRDIPYQIQPRRAGDIASCFADATLAQELLGWKSALDLQQMCHDSWHWQSNNPNGYI